MGPAVHQSTRPRTRGKLHPQDPIPFTLTPSQPVPRSRPALSQKKALVGTVLFFFFFFSVLTRGSHRENPVTAVFRVGAERGDGPRTRMLTGRVLDSRGPPTLTPTWGQEVAGTRPTSARPLPSQASAGARRPGSRLQPRGRNAGRGRHRGLAAQLPSSPSRAGGDPGSRARLPGGGGPRPRLPAPQP